MPEGEHHQTEALTHDFVSINGAGPSLLTGCTGYYFQ